MGAGVSSMNQMREALLSRADDLRQPGETLDEFFEQYTYRKGNQLYISLFAVKKALSVNSQWVDALFHNGLGDKDNDFIFSDFIEYMETGKLQETSSSTKRTQPIVSPEFDPVLCTMYPGVLRALKLNESQLY